MLGMLLHPHSSPVIYRHCPYLPKPQDRALWVCHQSDKFQRVNFYFRKAGGTSLKIGKKASKNWPYSSWMPDRTWFASSNYQLTFSDGSVAVASTPDIWDLFLSRSLMCCSFCSVRAVTWAWRAKHCKTNTLWLWAREPELPTRWKSGNPAGEPS